MAPQLRDYQLDVIERVRQRIRDGCRRILLQAPVGAGKTHVSSEMLRCAVARGKSGLFLAHRRRLIQQKSERLAAFGVPHGVIMSGYPRTNAPVQVASRDTLLSRACRNEWMSLPPADVVVVDEAHGCLADQYQDLLDRYRDSVVVGLTATPARNDGRGLGAYYQALECTAPISRLIADGHICPVRCYAPHSAVEGRKDRTKKPRRGLAGDPVVHWKTYGEGRPTILFADKVESSRAACTAFCKAGIPAEHIDAHTEDEEREAVVDRLRTGRTRVLCNVAVYVEGVDVPEISCCILLRMAGSYVLFIQAVGRAMRSHPSKRDCVLIDHAGAVLVHGFPDEDVEWTLDTDDSVDSRVKKAKKDGKMREPLICPRCACIFYASLTCPECGYTLPPRKDRKAKLRDELLVEVPRADEEPPELQQARRKLNMMRLWAHYKAMAATSGRKAGFAAVTFQKQFGIWPQQAGMSGCPSASDWDRPADQLWPQAAPDKN